MIASIMIGPISPRHLLHTRVQSRGQMRSEVSGRGRGGILHHNVQVVPGLLVVFVLHDVAVLQGLQQIDFILWGTGQAVGQALPPPSNCFPPALD